MDSLTPIFESSLLFQAPIDDDPAGLEEDVGRIARACDLTVRMLPTDDPAFRLFHLGEIQVLITGCGDPLPAAHFLEAQRPGETLLNETAVLARLTSHEYSLSVLVTDNPELPFPDCEERQTLKERLCRHITDALRERHRASLVFWSDTDMLFASEEFAKACGKGKQAETERRRAPATLEEGRKQFDSQRTLEANAMFYIQTQITQGAHRREARSQSVIERITGGQTSRDEMQPVQPLVRPSKHQVVRGASMMCSSAAIGICTMPVLGTMVFG
ncbi:hypothetical protein [Pseudoruegeria sp. HB172150]|uniref:hypothetical protein n=1 Tax=Pseudoruegeria sp. HB172150 TaxID=2721164 RepID=UPI0015568095|nr:hypothetical protein [Pseudoruegeria sp. HB172150]